MHVPKEKRESLDDRAEECIHVGYVTRTTHRLMTKNSRISKSKLNAEGKVCRYKSRLVHKGFLPREGVSFSEAFVAVSKLASIRLITVIGA